MKKSMLLCLFFCLCSRTLSGENMISPAIDYSRLFMKNIDKKEIGENPRIQEDAFAMSLDFEHVASNGFTFLYSNDLILGGRIRGWDSQNQEEEGSFWGLGYYANFIFGYTCRGVKNLFITGGSGMGFGFSMLSLDRFEGDELPQEESPEFFTWNPLGIISLYLGVQYYFTEKTGINIAFINSFGLGTRVMIDGSRIGHTITSFSGGISHVFTLKVGPVFRF